MKKTLSILAALTLSGVAAFANTDKNFRLITTIDQKNVFKVISPQDIDLTYAEAIADSLIDNLEDVTMNATSETKLKTVVVATNVKDHIIKVTATGTPLASDTATTKMGYDFVVDSNTPIEVSKGATSPVDLGTIVTVTGNGEQQVKQALLKATIKDADYKVAAAGNYVATIVLTAEGV